MLSSGTTDFVHARLQGKLNRTCHEIKQRPDIAYSYEYLQTEINKGPEHAQALLMQVKTQGTILDQIITVATMEYYDLYYQAPLQPLINQYQQLQRPNGISTAFMEAWAKIANAEIDAYSRSIKHLTHLSQILTREGALKLSPRKFSGCKPN